MTKKWEPTNTKGSFLSHTNPLLDNSNTPRGTKKKITLGRCFDHDPWMHSRTSLEGFHDEFTIKRDKAKNKILKRIRIK